jgi:hypothetical protein
MLPLNSRLWQHSGRLNLRTAENYAHEIPGKRSYPDGKLDTGKEPEIFVTDSTNVHCQMSVYGSKE